MICLLAWADWASRLLNYCDHYDEVTNRSCESIASVHTQLISEQSISRHTDKCQCCLENPLRCRFHQVDNSSLNSYFNELLCLHNPVMVITNEKKVRRVTIFPVGWSPWNDNSCTNDWVNLARSWMVCLQFFKCLQPTSRYKYTTGERKRFSIVIPKKK